MVVSLPATYAIGDVRCRLTTRCTANCENPRAFAPSMADLPLFAAAPVLTLGVPLGFHHRRQALAGVPLPGVTVFLLL